MKTDVFQLDSNIVNCDLIPRMQLAVWVSTESTCCSSVQSSNENEQLVCPFRNHTLTGDVESNEIRVKRSISSKSTSNLASIDRINDDTQTEEYLMKMSNELSSVQKTVENLKNRVNQLEHECKNEKYDSSNKENNINIS